MRSTRRPKALALALCSMAAMVVLWAPTVARADFGFEPGSLSVSALNRDGSPDLRASSHPYSLVVQFNLNVEPSGASEGGVLRNVITELPPGFFGNPSAMPTCPRKFLEGENPHCPGTTQVGEVSAVLPGLHGAVETALYNIAPTPGEAARLGFSLFQQNIFQTASVKTEGGYGLEVGTFNIPLETTAIRETIWGVPPDRGHDSERECLGPPTEEAERSLVRGCSYEYEPGSGRQSGVYLTMPASCGQALGYTFGAESALGATARETGFSHDAGGTQTVQIGCESVPFSPTATALATTAQASSSSGLGFQLQLPNQGLNSPEGVAETEPETTEVVFPQGVTVNPSSANGLAGCTKVQYQAASLASPGCPEASKIGTLTAKSPLLEEPIEGSVYLGAPHDNQFGSLIAVYFVAAAKERGVLVKQAGEGRLDPTTGQISTTFEHLPPLPYSLLELNLKEGPRAPLMTPQTCGTYESVARFYPFSAPGSPVERRAPFKITSGAEGGACVSSESQLPAHPTLEAGTVTPLAGAYSPFVFRVKRGDGEQRFSSIAATLPTGLLGRVTGVPYCPESGISQAFSRTQEGGGAEELASPSCPAASQVGTVDVGAGAGPQPFHAQGKAYLAGPYKGAPLSLEIITPAVAGPFDLGSVAVRAALYVNESTAQVTAVSDPLPRILHGIPLDVRTVSVELNRNEFTLNPTNCEAKSVTGSVTTFSGASAQLFNNFAIGGCKGLNFEPSLKLSFSGQMKRTGNPAVKAVLTQPKGDNANVGGVTVILPKGMLIDNAHIGNPCTRVQFNSTSVPGEGCPAKSILGSAKVWTPLLENPEEGKVYFRSNGGERQLPDLVVALRGQIPLQLVGFIDSVGKKNAEVRRVRSQFLNVPDAPVSRFELSLFGGKKGLLENSKNLCKAGDRAKFQIDGQNGKSHDTEPKVLVSCGKQKSK